MALKPEELMKLSFLDMHKANKIEQYDFVSVNLFEGLVIGRDAYDTLVKTYGCTDPRVSVHNVLKIRAPKFERIFVFYKDDSTRSVKDNILIG